MIELLKAYSIEEIIIFVILLLTSIGGIISFIKKIRDAYKNIITNALNKKQSQEEIENKFKEQQQEIETIEQDQSKINENICDILDKVNLLISSDRDDIKAYITKEHHFFCYEQGWIDDYSMDCLEKRFSHYVAEHGNSFVENLMDELRALPKQSAPTE